MCTVASVTRQSLNLYTMYEGRHLQVGRAEGVCRPGRRTARFRDTRAAARLVDARGRRYHEHMTVAQLLKRAKTLPKKQRERLVRGILALEKPSRENAPSGRRQTRVTWPDVEARAKLIVGDRVLPNLVLLERGEEAY
jgi:hypothetical protein